MIFQLHVFPMWQAERSREAFLEKLQAEYSLTDSQLSAIREIEILYHGSGSLVTRPIHKLDEGIAHRTAISREMSSEAAGRFLSAKDRSSEAVRRSH